MKLIAAALGDDADLTAATGAKLRRIVAGIHAEFLHVFHAGLQAEEAAEFTADVARVVADDAAGFDSIQPDCVLFERAAVEADVVKRASCEINCTRGKKVQL